VEEHQKRAATFRAVERQLAVRSNSRLAVSFLSNKYLLDEDLAIAVRGHRRDEPGALHVLDEARGAVVADAKVSLHEGDGGTAVLQDDLDGLVVEGIGFS
jgi:hypothetical protein